MGDNTFGEMKVNVKQINPLPSSTNENDESGAYEMVDHPTHYNNYSVEVIDMMERIWGTENTALWCEMTAFKYRMRLGTKPDNSVEQDLKKEQWYKNKAFELRNKIEK